jgi:hypothetical protein
MEKIHSAKITTLKNQEWWQKKNSKKGTYLFCQHLSNLQVYNASDSYYNEVANKGQRGGVCSNNTDAGIFDIAAKVDRGNLEQNVKEGFLNILQEKINSDLAAYEQMIRDMKNQGVISDIDCAIIKIQEVAARIIETSGISLNANNTNKEDLKKMLMKKMYTPDDKREKILNEINILVNKYCN